MQESISILIRDHWISSNCHQVLKSIPVKFRTSYMNWGYTVYVFSVWVGRPILNQGLDYELVSSENSLVEGKLTS